MPLYVVVSVLMPLNLVVSCTDASQSCVLTDASQSCGVLYWCLSISWCLVWCLSILWCLVLMPLNIVVSCTDASQSCGVLYWCLSILWCLYDAPQTCSGCTDAPQSCGICTDAPQTFSVCTDAPQTCGVCTDAPQTCGVCTDAPQTCGVCTDAPQTCGVCTDAPQTCGVCTDAPQTCGVCTDAPLFDQGLAVELDRQPSLDFTPCLYHVISPDVLYLTALHTSYMYLFDMTNGIPHVASSIQFTSEKTRDPDQLEVGRMTTGSDGSLDPWPV